MFKNVCRFKKTGGELPLAQAALTDLKQLKDLEPKNAAAQKLFREVKEDDNSNAEKKPRSYEALPFCPSSP